MRAHLIAALALGCASRSRPTEALGPDGASLDSANLDVGRTETHVELIDSMVVDSAPSDTAPIADTADEWDGAYSCDAPPGDGSRFCDLYRDVFSPIGSAKCQSSGCHGGSKGVKALAFGWTGESCYAAMITATVTWLTPPKLVDAKDGDSRPTSLLPRIVDPSIDAGLLMPWPKEDAGNRWLNDDERARIDAWLARGAPFD